MTAMSQPATKSVNNSMLPTKESNNSNSKVFLENLKNFGLTTGVKGVTRVLNTKQTCLRIIWLLAVITGLSISLYQCTLLITKFFSYGSITNIEYCSSCRAPFPDVTICNLNPLNALTEFHGETGFLTFDNYLFHLEEMFENVSDKDVMKYLNISENDLYAVYDEIHSVPGYFQNFNRSQTESLFEHVSTNRMVDSCIWYGWNSKPYRRIDCMFESIFTFYNPEYLACHTFRLWGGPGNSGTQRSGMDHSTNVSGLYAMLYLNDFSTTNMVRMVKSMHQSQSKGLIMVIHEQGTLPELSSGVIVPAGHEVQVMLTAQHYIRTSGPYSNCVEKKDIINSYNRFQYKYHDKNCYSLCYQEENLQNCKCFNPYFTYNDELQAQYLDYPLCGAVSDNLTNDIRRVNCYLFETIEKESSNCGHCKESCDHFVYNYNVHQADWPHETYYDIFFRSVINKQPYKDLFLKPHNLTTDDDYELIPEEELNKLLKTELIKRNFIQLKVSFQEDGHEIIRSVPELDISALMGTLGGILNLWIGISFFTFIELLDLVYKMLETIVCKQKVKPSSLVSVGATDIKS